LGGAIGVGEGNAIEAAPVVGGMVVDRGSMTGATSDVPALELSGLHKELGDKTAADHVNLVVPAGSLFGLVGPNGAGKSTTLAMSVGLLRPDYGRAFVFGRDVWREPDAATAGQWSCPAT